MKLKDGITWEKLVYIFTALSSCVAILYGAYVVGVSVTNFENKVGQVQSAVEEQSAILSVQALKTEKSGEVFRDFGVELANVTSELRSIRKGSLSIVYVNETHIIARLGDGTHIKIAKFGSVEEKLSKEDAKEYAEKIGKQLDQLQEEVDALKEVLRLGGILQSNILSGQDLNLGES